MLSPSDEVPKAESEATPTDNLVLGIVVPIPTLPLLVKYTAFVSPAGWNAIPPLLV